MAICLFVTFFLMAQPIIKKLSSISGKVKTVFNQSGFDIMPALCQPNEIEVTTEVSILDGEGELLALGAVRINDAVFSAFNLEKSHKRCLFSPDIVYGNQGVSYYDSKLTSTVSYTVEIAVDTPVLADMKDMKLEVKHREVSK